MVHNIWRQKLGEAARLLAADLKKSRYALAAIAAFLLLKKFFLHNACPLVALTGLPCPACGLTRAGIALLRGDLQLALKIHPFIYIFLLWCVFFLIWRYILEKDLRGLKKYAVLTLALLAGYYIYRMIRYFPGKPPMCYYYDNLMANVWHFISALIIRN